MRFINCGNVFNALLNVAGRRHALLSCDQIVLVSGR